MIWPTAASNVPTMEQQGGLRERAAASLLSVATAASLSVSVRLAALRTFADGQAVPIALFGEAAEAVLWPLQLSEAAALVAAAAAAHIAAGTNAARARAVALNAVWHASCKVLGEDWESQYSREALADAAAALCDSGGGSGAGRPQHPSVWDHLVALHTRLQAGLPAFAAVDLPTCCAILEMLYSGGSPYRAVLSRGGRLMAGAVLAVALCIAAPPAAVAAQPAAIELLADATGFPAEVLRSQVANILSFVLRSS